MNRDQFHEIRLRDFRCFHDEQTARLAPLTLLVGDNSTGKTSFLAAVRAVWDAAFRQAEPDFREPPYDPTKPSPDPEGAYMPTYFASVNFQDEDRWLKLKSHLEDFGRRSGLFDEITVKQLGEMEGGPFQLQIRKAGKHGASPRRNLIEREDSEVSIHSIRVADDGSIIDAPEGYRRFFKDELNRVINY